MKIVTTLGLIIYLSVAQADLIGRYEGVRAIDNVTTCSQEFSVDMFLGGRGRMSLLTYYGRSDKGDDAASAAALIETVNITYDQYKILFESAEPVAFDVATTSANLRKLSARTEDEVRIVTIENPAEEGDTSRGKAEIYILDGSIAKIHKKYERKHKFWPGFGTVLEDDCNSLVKVEDGLVAHSEGCKDIRYVGEENIRQAINRKGTWGTDQYCWQ